MRPWSFPKRAIEAPPMAPEAPLPQDPIRHLLLDLAHFCRAYETCFHADQRVHAALEGRREVWLRIRELYLDRPEDEEDIHRRFMELLKAQTNG